MNHDTKEIQSRDCQEGPFAMTTTNVNSNVPMLEDKDFDVESNKERRVCRPACDGFVDDPSPVAAGPQKEECIIGLAVRRCAHIQQHGSGSRMCGPVAACVACLEGTILESQRHRCGELVCHICNKTASSSSRSPSIVLFLAAGLVPYLHIEHLVHGEALEWSHQYHASNCAVPHLHRSIGSTSQDPKTRRLQVYTQCDPTHLADTRCRQRRVNTMALCCGALSSPPTLLAPDDQFKL